jgi:hypothetical protein
MLSGIREAVQGRHVGVDATREFGEITIIGGDILRYG